MYFNPESTAMSISFLLVLAKPQISAFKLALVIILIALRSPSEIIGNPASITSTPKVSSFFAMFNFCSGAKATPGVCSPSLNVVSKILTFMLLSSVKQQHQSLQFLIFHMVLLIPQMCLSGQELQ